MSSDDTAVKIFFDQSEEERLRLEQQRVENSAFRRPSGKGINIAELERREKEEADRRAQEEVDRKLKLIEERKKSLPKIDMTKKLDPPGASWKKVDTAEGSS